MRRLPKPDSTLYRSADAGPRAATMRRGTILLRSKSIKEKGTTMRFLLRVSFPVEAGNASARKDGFKDIQKILEQQKPEAAYFVAQDGKRTGLLIVNIEDACEIAALCEPWFLAFNAGIEVTPAMVPADLAKAASAIAQAVKAYG